MLESLDDPQHTRWSCVRLTPHPDHPVPGLRGTASSYIRTGLRFAISLHGCAEYPCQARGPGPSRLVARIQRRYDRIVAAAVAWHEAQPPLPQQGRGRPRRRPAHNLARALQTHRAETLRFLTNPAVPFTHNRAEQVLRMMKTRQKISGGFRTLTGAADFALLRSVETTARKLGWNRYELWRRTPRAAGGGVGPGAPG